MEDNADNRKDALRRFGFRHLAEQRWRHLVFGNAGGQQAFQFLMQFSGAFGRKTQLLNLHPGCKGFPDKPYTFHRKAALLSAFFFVPECNDILDGFILAALYQLYVIHKISFLQKGLPDGKPSVYILGYPHFLKAKSNRWETFLMMRGSISCLLGL
jgi:hypothetical protein